MNGSADHAALALEHFHFAGDLAFVFAAVCTAYLFAAWQIAGRLSSAMSLVLHTLYLGWQSNVAYLAVVALSAGQGSLQRAPGLAAMGWEAAPWMVPGAAVLYSAMLVLAPVFYWLRGRQVRSHRHG